MPAAPFHLRRNRARAAAAALLAAAAATIASDFASAATVNGTVAPAEYATTLATQTTPTGFGDNFSELNQALSNYIPGGNLELALTGNLEDVGNGLILFIDSKPGGGVASSVGHGFNQFGSISGARTQTWGTDIDPGTGVTAPAGGASVLAPGFNPDYAIEIHNTGGAAYFINVIDLSLPNTPANNRDIALGSAPLNSGAATTHTYNRLDTLGNPVDSGDVTSSFNNTNVDGVTDTSAAGAATAAKGLELIFEGQFLGQAPGHALRIMPFITSSDGQVLSNQFLPGLGGGVDNLGPANDPIGTPLFDARNFSDRFYLDVFVPTLTAATAGWTTAASWTGAAAPNGAEHAARISGSTAQTVNIVDPITLGYLELSNAAGTTIGGGGSLAFNGGNGAAATFVTAGNHAINAVVHVHSDWRVNVAAGSSVATSGLSAAANKTITKVGAGTLTLGGTQMQSAAGLKLDVQNGAVAVNGNLGTGLATATAPDVTVGIAAGGSAALVNFGASQTLRNITVHPDANVNVLQQGGRAIVADTIAVTGNARFDLADNNMVLRSTPVGTFSAGTYGGVQGLIQRAYRNSSWDQPGLTTSMSQAAQGLTGLAASTGAAARGIAPTATATWNGLTVQGSDVLVMYTYAGDLNLDGRVDAQDYGIIDNWVQFPGTAGYANGDINYDGVIDAADYGIIDNTIQLQGPPLADSSSFASVTAVPEPAACGFALLAAATTLCRRRRRAR